MTALSSRSRIFFAIACVVVPLSHRACIAQAPAVATGDTRTVTEPVFPATCQALLASFHDVNEDVPLSVETGNTSLDLTRLQAALNACQGTNQAVELSMDSSGNNAFLTGPISIPTGVTLLIDAGVTLYFSRNAQDYDTTPGTHTCGTVSGASNTGSCKNLISIKNTNNSGIMGYGKINARGGDVVLNSFVTTGYGLSKTNDTWWDIANDATTYSGSQQNPRAIQLSNSNNVTLYKFTFKNPPNFHIAISGGNGITIWGIKIVTPYTSHNTDGIDPGNTTNVTIKNTSISDGDDNVAVGASGSLASNISVINNRFFAGHGESIGSFTNGGVNNVLYDSNMMYGDADVDGSNSTGIRIKSANDRGGVVQNIQYSNSCFANHGTQIQFTPIYNTNAGTLTPNFKNILLQNLRFSNQGPVATGSVTFLGASNNGTVNPLVVTLDNVTIDTLAGSNLVTPSNAQITLGPGQVSSNLVSLLTPFNGVNGNVITNNTSGALAPPVCVFTFLTPELTGPTAQTQTVAAGQFPTAVAILTPAIAATKYPYPTGTVTLTDEASRTFTATLPGTGDTIFIPITNAPVGTHTYTASYSGNSVYPAITTFGSYVVTVSSASLATTTTAVTGVPAGTTFGTPFIATATLTGSGSPSGSIQFLVNGSVYATVPISGGSASYTFNSTIGSYAISAAYSGDSANAGSFSTPATVTVAGATTTTVLQSSGTTSTVGVPVTLTATVSSAAGTPVGTVSFSYTNGTVTTPTVIGSAALVNGIAGYSAFLPQGTDSVVATYVASGNFGASASTNAVSVIVNPTPPVPAASVPLAMPYTISTIASGGTAATSGSACPGTSGTSAPKATDTAGDGCPATSILLQTGATAGDLRSVTVDPFGNIYFTDGSAALIRKIATNGIIGNFAGRASNAPTACTPTVSPLKGCNPLAVSLSSKPRGVYSDPFWNIYIAGYGNNIVHVVRVSDGLMYIAAGNGTAATQTVNGDGGLAISAQLNQPRAITTDAAGNIYIASTGEDRVREVLNPNSGAAGAGTITTVVGSGYTTAPIPLTPDDVNAVTATNLTIPQGVAVDASANIFVSTDTRVRAVCVTCSPGSALYSLLTILGYSHIVNGNIYTVAGTITSGSNPTLTPGLGNTVNLSPQKIVVDPNGNLYIADSANNVVWFEDGRTGWTHVIAGGGNSTSCAGSTVGDGCKATLGVLGSNGGNGIGVGLDLQGNLYVSDSTNLRIRKVSNDLRFGSSPVGTAVQQTIQVHFLPGDTPLAASLTSPDFSLAAPTCVLNAADTTTDCTYPATFKPVVAGLRFTPLAITTTLGNPGSFALIGSGTGAGATLDPANQITFGLNISPSALAVDNAGNVYVADSASKNVLKFAPGATGTGGGSAATSTTLQSFMNPTAVTVDALGNTFVADASTGLVSVISPSGVSKTLSTVFNTPDGLAVDALNNLYVADAGAKTITEIGSNLVAARTIASAGLTSPAGIAVDGNANLFVADSGAGTIVRIDAQTFARTTASSAAAAPHAVAVDAAGNLLIADTASNQVLAVPANTANAAFSVASGVPGNTLALDSAGNVYTSSATNQVLELQRTMGTATYNGVGSAPGNFTLLSTGNAAANLSMTDPDTTNFALSVATNATCTGSVSALVVVPGGACTFTSSFAPTERLNYTNAATFTGNAGNASLGTPPTLEIVQVGNNAPFVVSFTFGGFTPSPAFVGNTVTLTAAVSSAFGNPAGTVTFAVDGTALPPSTVASGAASTTVSGLAAGNHMVTATFTSTDPNFANATATPTTLTVQKNFVSALLAVQNASPVYGAANSATVTLTASAGTPTGTVQFTVDGTASGAPVAVSSAAATYTLPVLTAGPHTIAASYSGNSTFVAATAAGIAVTVSMATPTATWTAPASIVYGTALSATQLNATASVPGTFVYTPAAGTVLGAATQTLSVTFTPTDTVDYTVVTKTQSIVVTPASQTINFTAPTSPVVFGISPITLVATGGASGNAVTFSVLSGPGTISGGTLTVIGTGTIQVAANQAGNANYTAAAQVTQSIVVNKATPLVGLQASANPALVQTSITLTATVSGGATGTVTFLDGTTALGTGTLTSGVATLTTSTLAAGSHSITAVYSGDANFATLTSAVLTEAVDDFSLIIPTGDALTVLPGGTAVFTLTMSPVGATTFPAAVTLSLSGLPAGATYAFSPATLPAGSGTTTVTLTIQVPQSSAAALPIRINGDGIRIGGSNTGQVTMASRDPNVNQRTQHKLAPVALALLLLPFAGRMRRAGKKLGRAMSILLLIVAAITATMGLSGCGASGSGFFAQSPKSYSLTVTGTSGAVSRSTNLTLTVE